MTVSKKIEPGWKEIVIHGAPTDINLILSNANGVNPTWGTVEIPGDMDSEIKAAYLDVYAWIRTTGSVGNTASVSENQVDVDNDLASGAMKSNTISKTSLPFTSPLNCLPSGKITVILSASPTTCSLVRI